MVPLALGAGVKVRVPSGAMAGWMEKRALLSLETWKVRDLGGFVGGAGGDGGGPGSGVGGGVFVDGDVAAGGEAGGVVDRVDGDGEGDGGGGVDAAVGGAAVVLEVDGDGRGAVGVGGGGEGEGAIGGDGRLDGEEGVVVVGDVEGEGLGGFVGGAGGDGGGPGSGVGGGVFVDGDVAAGGEGRGVVDWCDINGDGARGCAAVAIADGVCKGVRAVVVEGWRIGDLAGVEGNRAMRGGADGGDSDWVAVDIKVVGQHANSGRVGGGQAIFLGEVAARALEVLGGHLIGIDEHFGKVAVEGVGRGGGVSADVDGVGGERSAGVRQGALQCAVDPDFESAGGAVAAQRDDLETGGVDIGRCGCRAQAGAVVVTRLIGELGAHGLQRHQRVACSADVAVEKIVAVAVIGAATSVIAGVGSEHEEVAEPAGWIDRRLDRGSQLIIDAVETEDRLAVGAADDVERALGACGGNVLRRAIARGQVAPRIQGAAVGVTGDCIGAEPLREAGRGRLGLCPDDQRRVLKNAVVVIGRRGIVVHGRDGDANRCGSRPAVAVADGVREGVKAVPIGQRRVGDACAGEADSAMGALGDAGDGQRIAVDVRVIGARIEGDGRVLARGDRVGIGCRIVVDVVDRNVDGGRIALGTACARVALVVTGDLNAGGSVVIEVRSVGHSIQGGVDVGERAGEDHGRIGGAVARGERQAGGRAERESAVGDGERDLFLAAEGIHIGDSNEVSVGDGEDQDRVFVHGLRRWDVVHGCVVLAGQRDIARAEDRRDVEHDTGRGQSSASAGRGVDALVDGQSACGGDGYIGAGGRDTGGNADGRADGADDEVVGIGVIDGAVHVGGERIDIVGRQGEGEGAVAEELEAGCGDGGGLGDGAGRIDGEIGGTGVDGSVEGNAAAAPGDERDGGAGGRGGERSGDGDIAASAAHHYRERIVEGGGGNSRCACERSGADGDGTEAVGHG